MTGTDRIARKFRDSRATARGGGEACTSGKNTGARFRTAFPATPSPGRIRKSNRAHSSISAQEDTHGTRYSPRVSRR
jgi:hypothetical protein